MRGGVSDSVAELVKALAERGHELHVLSSPQAQTAYTGVTLHNSMSSWGMNAPRQIRRWAQVQQLDVVNLHYQTAMYGMSGWMHFVPQVLRRVGLPCVVTFHDLRFPYLFPKAGDALRTWFVHHLARSATRAVVTNHEDRATLSQAYVAEPALIPIGSAIHAQALSPSARQAIRAQVGTREGEFVIGHFGFLYPNRGLETLLHALHTRQQAGDALRLLMIGGREGGPTDPAYVRQMDALIEQLKLSDRIHWTGYANPEQVSSYLQACDLIALPFRDGASYRRSSLMAAIQHACAILTTEPLVAVERFQQNVNLYLTPPDDSSALAEALAQLYQHPERVATLRAGVQHLAQDFQWTDIAHSYERVFEQARRA